MLNKIFKKKTFWKTLLIRLNLLIFFILNINKFSYKNKWISFYFARSFELSYEQCGYFDPRHRINICLIFFRLCIILPIYSKYTDECDPPTWGISYFDQTFWIYRGGKGNFNGGNKWWTIHMPWMYDWVRTSNLRKDGTWEHDKKGHRSNFYEDKWNKVLWNENYPYTYNLKSGKIQNRLATIKVVEMEWRFHWFKWLPFPRKISNTIDISFDREVGEGGCTGCSYTILKNETPLECLRRMEKNRKFKLNGKQKYDSAHFK